MCVVDFEAKQMEKIPFWYEQQLDILKWYDQSHSSVCYSISLWTMSTKYTAEGITFEIIPKESPFLSQTGDSDKHALYC